MKRGSVRLLTGMLLVLAIAIFLLSGPLILDVSAQNETNYTAEPNVAIQLAKTKYSKGEALNGKLILKITNATSLDEYVTARVPGTVKRIKLIDLLTNMSLNFTVKKGGFEGANPLATKLLDIGEGAWG